MRGQAPLTPIFHPFTVISVYGRAPRGEPRRGGGPPRPSRYHRGAGFYHHPGIPGPNTPARERSGNVPDVALNEEQIRKKGSVETLVYAPGATGMSALAPDAMASPEAENVVSP